MTIQKPITRTVYENVTEETRAPGSSDDASQNFGLGSIWIDTVTDTYYICVDDTVGAAVWEGSRFFQFSDGGGLTAIYTGGRWRGVAPDGFFFNVIPGASIVLTDNITNFVQMTTSGTVFNNTTAFFTTSLPLAEIVTSGGVITSITQRFFYSGTISDRYQQPDSAFPQQIWGLNNATTTAFLDIEGGPLQIQGLNGAGASQDVFVGGAASQTGQLLSSDGSAASPSRSFIGDTTSGHFFIAGGVGTSFSGVERQRVVDPVAAADVSLMVEHNDGIGKIFKQMSAGAADSESVGFRSLRIPN